MQQPEPVIRVHADHDPSLICRPALGYGLCEPIEPEEDENPSLLAAKDGDDR